MKADLYAPFPEKIVVVRCFDPRVDVPLHALYKELEALGCTMVREANLAGGGIIYARYPKFALEQIGTFLHVGYTGVILVPHTNCKHIHSHNLIPKELSEENFLENEMRKAYLSVQENFPDLFLRAYCINTETSQNGIQSIVRCKCSPPLDASRNSPL